MTTDSATAPLVHGFHDKPSGTITYLVIDPASRKAAVVDPVLGFDAASGRTSELPLEPLIERIASEAVTVDWILETHAHADHISGAPVLRERIGGKIGIGEGIREVQKHFNSLFNLEPSISALGESFDQLFSDREVFAIGSLNVQVMHTPGHTPSCMTYVVGDAAFVGDTLFMPDGGTARADFPGGDAATLYQSIQRILALDPDTRIFVCHDYGPGGRDVSWETTVREQREANIHVGKGLGETDYVKLRTERDATLSLPTLIVPSIQLNIRAGEMPPPEDNGVSYIKVPINQL